MPSNIDRRYWKKGLLICGVDEVGRGAIAGPVVAAAVVFPSFSYIKGIKDSKEISPSKREEFLIKIYEKAIDIQIGIVGPRIIEEINIRMSSFLAMRRAIYKLKLRTDFDVVLIDGYPPLWDDLNIVGIVKGDKKSFSISAASIVAKVTRDRLMRMYHKVYPDFGWITNVGYPTPFHKHAIRWFGVSPIHRRTFKPVFDVINEEH